MRLVRQTRGRVFPRWQQFFRIHKILSPKEYLIFRVSLLGIFLSVLWFLVIFINNHRIGVPTVGGQYVEGVVGTPELINPVFSSLSDVDTDLARLIFNGLMRYDEKGRLVPDVASAFSVSPDKLTYTFQLRHDAVWHDGESFTANDVAFTIETIQNPAVGSPLYSAFQGIEVTVVDPFTIQFKLKESFAPFLSSLTVGIIPEHVWGDVPPERMRLNKYNLQPIGSGPYKFSKLLKDETGYIYRYEVVRNDHYYRNSAFIELIALQFYNEYEGSTGVIQAFREQKIDGISFVPHDLKDSVERKHVALHMLELPQYTALFFNQEHNSSLKDKSIRQALEQSIDKVRIVREALKGDGDIIYGPILSSSPGYSASTTKITYSIDEANKILDSQFTRIPADEYKAIRREALLKEVAEMASSTQPIVVSSSTTTSTDTASMQATVDERLQNEIQAAQTFYRKDKSGNILSVTIVTADTPEYKQIAKLVAGSWQEIGVKTNVELVHPKDVPRQVLKDRDYDVLLYGLIIGSDPDQFPFWHSSQVDFPGLNLSRYSNRNVDDLLQKARATTDVSDLSSLYSKIQDQIIADRPAIFLYTPTYTYATTDKIFGIMDGLVFQPSDRFNTVTNWYVKTKGKWSF